MGIWEIVAVVGFLAFTTLGLARTAEEAVPPPELPPPAPEPPPPAAAALSPTAQKIATATAPYLGAIETAAARWGVDPAVIRAIIWRESRVPGTNRVDPAAARFEPKINDTSYGLMQVLLGTARSLGFAGTVQDLLDPYTNIDLGAHYLASKLADYGDLSLGVAAYNSGTPYLTDHTLVNQAYVDEVLTNSSALAGVA